MHLLVLDNYDSFTYNLVQYLKELTDHPLTVVRNDAISVEDVDLYDGVVLSPGPGLPAEAGIMPALIRRYAGKKPILGVCLGHQAIGEAFGARLLNLEKVYHGLATPMEVVADHPELFAGLPANFMVGRYHSWVIDPDRLPESLEVTAVDTNGQIMALRHRKFPLHGVQFHPESILTEHGKPILANFLQHCFSLPKIQLT